MKLTCPKKEFHEAVSAAAAASSVRTSVHILQSVKIDATGDRVRIVGCDGEMWAERRLPCIIEEPGQICLPAKMLTELVASLAEGDVTLQTIDGSSVLVTQKNSEYRVPSLDAADFPEPPEYGGDANLSLPMGELKDAVDSVIFAVSADPHRQQLQGVLLNYNGEVLTLVATDTHRLAVRKLEKGGIGDNVNAVVPEKALKAIKSLPLAEGDVVTVKFGGGRAGVESDSALVVTQLLAGTYPNWERVVPNETTRSWSVESDQLEDRVKRALIVARESAFRIRFKGEADQLLISAKGEERGEAKEELLMVGANGDVEIAFNGKYVLDALSPIKGPGVRVEMTESMRPAVFRPADDEQNYFCVIMPMSLN